MAETLFDITEAGQQRRLAVTKPLILIGRSSQCDVRLSSPQVSARHARVRLYEDSAVIEDLGSSNGILVDGARINEPRRLSAVNLVQFGPGGPTLRLAGRAGAPASELQSTAPSRSPSPMVLGAFAVGCMFFVLLGAVSAGALALIWSRARGNTVSSLAADELGPAVGMVVVGLLTVDTPPKYLPLGTGTAFAITSDGFLLTNKHVVQGVRDGSVVPTALRETGRVKGVQVWVAIQGRMHPAEIRYVSGENDLSILKIDQQQMPYFRLAAKNDVEHLTRVFAVGFPGAASVALSDEEKFEEQLRGANLHDNIRQYFKDREFDYSLTDGSVSRMSKESNGRHWIQHTVTISPGNSGGPLCTEDGTVIGINTQGILESGILLSLCVGQLRQEIESVTQSVTWDR